MTRLVVVGVLVLSACASGDPGVSAPAGKVLDAQVDALRVSAAQADRRGMSQRLVLLRGSVEQLVADGEISESAAERIRDAADAVEALLPAPTTTTTTTTTTTLPPEADSDSKGNRDRKDKDDEERGNGNGRND